MKTALTLDEYKEVKAKKTFLLRASDLYSKIPELLLHPISQKYKTFEMMFYTEAQFGEKLGDKETTNQEKEAIFQMMGLKEKLNETGMAPGIDMKRLFEKSKENLKNG